MKEILLFFNDIFNMSDSGMKVGLSQFKDKQEQEKPVKTKTAKSETKISDLMRGI